MNSPAFILTLSSLDKPLETGRLDKVFQTHTIVSKTTTFASEKPLPNWTGKASPTILADVWVALVHNTVWHLSGIVKEYEQDKNRRTLYQTTADKEMDRYDHILIDHACLPMFSLQDE